VSFCSISTDLNAQSFLRLAKLAIARLQKVLDTCLLRRKKDSMLDGKRLVELPSKEVTLHRLQFTEEEREIYQAVGLFSAKKVTLLMV